MKPARRGLHEACTEGPAPSVQASCPPVQLPNPCPPPSAAAELLCALPRFLRSLTTQKMAGEMEQFHRCLQSSPPSFPPPAPVQLRRTSLPRPRTTRTHISPPPLAPPPVHVPLQ